MLSEGWPIVRIGIPYVLAAVAGAMATGEVFSYLNDTGEVGLYRAGMGLMMATGAVILKAAEADFFPRLSSVNHDMVRLNHAINQQVDVCVLLVAPVLIPLVMFMPVVVRILWTDEFMPVSGMVVCGAFYIFLRSITTPIAYTALAKADSWLYFIMELLYDIVLVLLLRWGYSHMGLLGAGWALSAISLFDLLLIGTVYGLYYRVRLRISTIRLILPQTLMLAIVVAVSLSGMPPLYRYPVGICVWFFSSWFSLRKMSVGMPILQRLRDKLGL